MHRCSCGKEFFSEQALAVHQVSCKGRTLVAILVLLFLALMPTPARASPVMVTAVIRDGANQPMPGVTVDVTVASQDISASFVAMTNDRGEVSFPAAPGDEVTVRAGSDCHKATKEVSTTDDPYIMVKPSCQMHLPVVRTPATVQGATRFWGG